MKIWLVATCLLITVMFAAVGCYGFLIQVEYYGWLFAGALICLAGATMIEMIFKNC